VATAGTPTSEVVLREVAFLPISRRVVMTT
jgi:hypothetical protein